MEAKMSYVVSTDFDGGSINVLAISDDIRLSLVDEHRADGGVVRQHFMFRVTRLATASRDFRVCIVNSDRATFAGSFTDYNVCASYDGVRWFRIPTTAAADGSELSWAVSMDERAHEMFFAYFPSYPHARLMALIAEVQMHPAVVAVEWVGRAPDPSSPSADRLLPIINITGSDAARMPPTHRALQVWLLARQHPGETQGSFWMEGFLRRILSPSPPDDAVRRLLAADGDVRLDFHVAPCVNVAGAVAGRHRTNGHGYDLNRSWGRWARARLAEEGVDTELSAPVAPEVDALMERMDVTGVDLLIDCHGDETMPYAFLSKTALAAPGVPDAVRELRAEFLAAYQLADPALETPPEEPGAVGAVQPVGYPEPAPGKADLSICSAAVAAHFGCLAVTLEMPFKGNANASSAESREGWSVEDCTRMGGAAVDAIAHISDKLWAMRSAPLASADKRRRILV